jgi:hypothetical protein
LYDEKNDEQRHEELANLFVYKEETQKNPGSLLP